MNINTFALAEFQKESWAITSAGAMAWLATLKDEAPASQAPGKTFLGDTIPKMEIHGGIAIIPVSGPIIARAGYFHKAFGAVAHGDIAADVSAATADTSAKAILLNITSPGGTVASSPELARQIAGCTKPVYAFTDSQMCSAAFWIAAGAKAIFATESSQVGSVGVILETVSFAKALESNGVEVNVFASGAFKSAGHSALTMTAEGRNYFQSRSDVAGDMFRRFISQHRPRVSDGAMQGQVYFGSEAKGIGLVDEVVDSIDDVIARITSASSFTATRSVARPAAAAGLSYLNAFEQKCEQAVVSRNRHSHIGWRDTDGEVHFS